ncbi:hypothetical protein BHE74_00034308 [Ensete ventricosum]|nr:hypothetical protein GW17_00021878 [Ensete ventricosum]RWW58797.1 hypothetical protein BHE74_00034308 [Ensete ventricosum]
MGGVAWERVEKAFSKELVVPKLTPHFAYSNKILKTAVWMESVTTLTWVSEYRQLTHRRPSLVRHPRRSGLDFGGRRRPTRPSRADQPSTCPLSRRPVNPAGLTRTVHFLLTDQWLC